MKYRIPDAEHAQARKVNEAYAMTNCPNPEYEREFDILSDMRRASMAEAFRKSHGLSPFAKTPYCPSAQAAA